jgi:hypothetical protein
VRTNCGRHCDLLALVGALAGTRIVIHSCSSLNISVPRSLPSDDPITGTGIRGCPGMSCVGQGLTGEGLGVGVCARAGTACSTMKLTMATAIGKHEFVSIGNRHLFEYGTCRQLDFEKF